MALLGYEGEKTSAEMRNINEDEVIENFGELIRRSEKARTNQNLRSVISKLEENIKDNEKYIIKMFLVNNKTGSMINSDNSPNISFRVDTINNIFDSIVDSITDAGLTEEQVGTIFFNAGKKCGEAFGMTFNTYLETYIDVQDSEEKIKEWCMFDSSVGWGKLGYDANEQAIVITNNFQAKKIDISGTYPHDCNFFKGYISGVLAKISGRKTPARVECKSCDKCPKHSNERDCVIKFVF